MENFDVVVLTLFVVVSFIVFLAGSIKEFNKMEEEPYEFEKASGPTRAALFNAIKSLLEKEEAERKNEEVSGVLKREIADMHSDGVHFNDETKEEDKKKE